MDYCECIYPGSDIKKWICDKFVQYDTCAAGKQKIRNESSAEEPLQYGRYYIGKKLLLSLKNVSFHALFFSSDIVTKKKKTYKCTQTS